MQLFKTLAACTLVVNALAACGGGDSSGGDSVPKAAITADNAEQAASVVVKTSSGVQDLGDASSGLTGGVLPRSAVTGSIEVNVRTLSNLVIESAGNLEAVTVGPETEPCPVSGSITFIANIQDPNGEQVSPGDSVSLTANGCADGNSVVNGTITLVINRFSIGPSGIPFDFSASVTIAGFSIAEGSETSAVNGDMTISLASKDGVTTTTGLSGNSISVSFNGDTSSLFAFAFNTTVNDSNGAYTLSSNGTVDAAELGGAVTFQTVVPFQGVGEAYPDSGEMLITGADNSLIRLVVIDSVNVRLDVDADGDGNFEGMINTTWAALDS